MSKEEAIKLLLESKDNDIERSLQEWKEWDKRYFEAIDMAIEALSAERRGHWIDMNTPTSMYMPRYKCSICGNSANYSKYCPNCGADMRGENNG